MEGKKKVLVTGGAGFIGSFFCEALLERSDDVLCVDNFYTESKDNVHGAINVLGLFQIKTPDGGLRIHPKFQEIAGAEKRV